MPAPGPTDPSEDRRREVGVPIGIEGLSLQAVAARFHDEHTRLSTFTLEVEHELVNLCAVVQAERTNVADEHIATDGDVEAAVTGSLLADTPPR